MLGLSFVAAYPLPWYGAALFVSLGALWWAGDRTVDYALTFAKDIGVSPFIIGTFFTSVLSALPELVVAMFAISHDVPALAVGDVIGSNICDVSIVLFIPSLIAHRLCLRGNRSTTILIMLTLSAVAMLTFLSLQMVPHWLGFLFLLIYLVATVLLWRRQSFLTPPVTHEVSDIRYARTTLFDLFHFVVAAILTALSGSAVVYLSQCIAAASSLTLGSIGVLVLAIGTALPEITIDISAARRGVTDLVLGNTLGSIFSQTFLVLGSLTAFSHTPLYAVPFRSAIPFIFILYLLLGYRFHKNKALTLLDTSVLTGIYAVYYVWQIL